MTEAEEIGWALKILKYEGPSLEKGKDIPLEVEKNSELVQWAIMARVDNTWHDDALEAIDKWAHEISSTTDIGQVTRRSTMLSDYWRWGLWMDCMADVPEMVELLFQGLVGAAFDAARTSTKELNNANR